MRHRCSSRSLPAAVVDLRGSASRARQRSVRLRYYLHVRSSPSLVLAYAHDLEKELDRFYFIPKEITERLSRMEQAVEATAVEVERIGEGQRFLTRLFTEGEGARAIGAGAAQPLERKQAKSPERLP